MTHPERTGTVHERRLHLPGRTIGDIGWSLAYWIVAAMGVFGLLVLVTSPVMDLLGDSAYAVPSTFHGVVAILYVVVARVTAYLVYLMYTDRLERYRDLRILVALGSFFAALTILFGTWIYIAYRAPAEGPRGYFLETQPSIHEIFFESKESMALFTLPIMVAATYVLYRHRDDIRQHGWLRQATAVSLVLGWLYLVPVFGLGAAITRLRSV